MKSAINLFLSVVGMLVSMTAPVSGQVTCLSDSFTYGDGDLSGNSLWTGGTGKVHVLSNQVQLNFNEADTTSAYTATYSLATPCGDCSIAASFKVKRGSSNVDDSFRWQVTVEGVNPIPANNGLMAWWSGKGLTALGRVGGSSTATSNANIPDTGFTTLKAVMFPNLAVPKTVFYQDNVAYATVPWPNGLRTNTSAPFTYVNSVTKMTITLNKIASTTGVVYLDDVSIISGPCSCLTGVDPPLSQYIGDLLAVALPSGSVLPASFPYTLNNLSTSSSTNFGASEVKADGSATDYPWLSLAPTSGSVGPLGNTIINAALTSPATPGLYSANLKITDDCSPADTHIRPVLLAVGSVPCVAEAFQYPSGNFVDSNTASVINGGWVSSGSGTPSLIQVIADPDDANNQVLKLNFANSTGAGAVLAGLGCDPCEDGTLTVVARIKGSTGTSAVSRAWQMNIRDAANHDLATWQGTFDSVRGRTRGAGNFTDYATVNNTSFHEIKAIINTNSHVASYYFDGALLGGTNPQSYGTEIDGTINIGRSLGAVALSIFGDNPTVDGYMLIDDIQVLSCTGTCIASVKPALGNTQLPYALTGGAAVVGAPINLTLANDGLENVGYSAQTVDINGSPFTYSWLSLINPTGSPLTPQTNNGGTLTANIDTTGLPKGSQFGFVKITTDTCSPSRTYTRSIELNIDDCATESFGSLPNGDLAAQPGWFTNTPLGVTSPIQVLGGVVKITGETLPTSIDAQHLNFGNCPVCDDADAVTPGKQGDDLISIKVRIRGHNGGSELWELHVTNNSLTTDLGSWFGSANAVTPKTIGGEGNPQPLTGAGVFDQLEAKINVNTNSVDGIPGLSTRFYFNGTNVATLGGIPIAIPDNDPGGGGVRVRNVRFVQVANDFSGDADPSIEFDDLVISRCVPGCHDPVFDVRNSNGDPVFDDLIDDHDLDAFEACTGSQMGNSHGHEGAVPNPNLSFECKCLDVNHDTKIDMNDFAVFQRCYTGSTVGIIDPNCDN